MRHRFWLIVAIIVSLAAASALGQPLSTAFSYQGELQVAGALADGSFDFEFSLYDSPGSSGGVPIAGPIGLSNVPVRSGIFSVELDFGPGVFGGLDLWLEVAVRASASSDEFTTLIPRSAVNPVPLAQQAAGVAVDAVGAPQLAAGAVGSSELDDGAVAGIDVDPDQIQLRISASCPAGSYLRQVGRDGSVLCQPDQDTDTDTQYTAGSGLVLSGGEFSVDPLETQVRVSGSCPPGESIRVVASDGSVACEPDSDSQYSAGSGLQLAAGQFAVDPAQVQTRIEGTCVPGSFVTAVGQDGALACAEPDALRLDPLVQSGFSNLRLSGDAAGNYGWIPFPRGFTTAPITLLSVDESLNDAGATWVRIRRETRRRLGVRADATVDGLHWFAMDPGIFTIDEKLVQAGKASPAVSSQAIFFPQLFPAAPVVFLAVDESLDDSGASRGRVIGTVSDGGFQIWLDAGADGINWVAMEPGDYNHGRFFWRAGTHVPGGCSNPCSVTFASELAGTPTVLLQIHDVNNSGPTWVRVLNATSAGFEYRLQSADAEFVNFLAVLELP